MTNETRAKPVILPVVDWVASHISSPVLRLGFLRTAMRPPQPKYRRWGYHGLKSWLLIPFPAVLLLFTAPAAPRIPAAIGFRHPPPVSLPRSAEVHLAPASAVWQVENTKEFETYSNGLRIDNRFSVANRRRSYLAFSARKLEDIGGQRRTIPAGIVFHTTESLQAPFEPGQNAALERIGESLLAYVKLKRAYNFLIDRFGRVYRVVLESDAANHAGYSIWSDPESVYLNLNQSFLAVSFETQTLPGQLEATVNPAQIRSGAMLTEMLRKRYGIPAGNCVTHAQVSVNAYSLRIGYHLDWASSFPFEQLGLPDNYALPLPSVSLFGLEYDSKFERQAGARLYGEAELAEHLLFAHAAADSLQISAYRKILQKGYRIRLAAVRRRSGQAEQEE